jgi:hypothetical protein
MGIPAINARGFPGKRFEWYRAGMMAIIFNLCSSIVKKIFSLYMKNNSLQKIAEQLNNAGIKTLRNKKFSKQTIQKILKNKFYTGVVTFKNIEKKGKHERLISKTIFNKVQTKLKQNRRNNRI